MEHIAKIIADLRKQKGWSQTDLATASKVSREIFLIDNVIQNTKAKKA